MKIKILSLAALFLGSAPCFGHMIYSNWLMGVSGGFSAQKTRAGIDVVYTQPAIVVPTPAAANIYDFHSSGFSGGALIGYQQVCRRWLVGIEAELNWQNIDLNESVTFSDNNPAGFGWTEQINARTKASAALTSRFGFVLDTMVPDVMVTPYIRLGVEANQQTLDVQYFGVAPFYPYAAVSQAERWPIRFIGGAGLEFPLYASPIALRMEYVYHSKGQSLNSTQSIRDGGIINPNFSTDMNSETNGAKIALIWNFY